MLNKRAVEEVCHNLNYRHKQAQYCGRASVLLNTHLFFKDKVEELEGFGGWAAIKNSLYSLFAATFSPFAAMPFKCLFPSTVSSRL